MSARQLDLLSMVLVEPSRAQQKIIEALLRRLGVQQIRTVQTGAETLALMKSTTLDMVVSAMHLPDMTGTELLETIRHGDTQRDIPFMLISSETSYRYLEPIRQAGAIAILPKPFELEQLKTALYAVLDYYDPGQLHTQGVALDQFRVLLVDDSALSRRHIRRVLEAMGIEDITEAENGQIGFELVQNHFYDLIVTDLYMPEMDGKQFVEQVRQVSQQASVPILMVSSETDATRLAVVQQTGVSAIIDKPFDTSTIKNIIESIVD